MKRELVSVDETIKECSEEIKDLGIMISKVETKTNSHDLIEKEIAAL